MKTRIPIDVPASAPSGSRPGRAWVRERIQGLILDGVLRPGARIRQLQLAERFGVSQGVVREALLELQAFGLVETVHNRGAFVSRITAQRLLESLDVRAVLEGLAARLCAEHTTRAQVRELDEIAGQVYALAMEHDPAGMTLLDRRLHDRIIELSGNATIGRLAAEHRVLGLIIRVGRDPQVVLDEHRAVLRAIEEGRGERAERLMRRHICAVKDALRERLARGDFVPEWVADAQS